MLQHHRFFANFATLRETSFVLKIIQAETDDQIDEVWVSFCEYESWHGMDLCFQDYEQELAELPWKYVKPEGRLFLAYSDDKLAGCIAMRKLDDGICEMKRLFVRDGFRGEHIGVSLVENLSTKLVPKGI